MRYINRTYASQPHPFEAAHTSNRITRQRSAVKQALCFWTVLLLCLLHGCSNGQSNDPDGNRVDNNQSARQGSVNEVVRGDAIEGRLLFVQQGTIWLWQGREGRRLLGSGEAWQPAWSPNGTQIAYVRRGNDYSDIMLADANGTPLKRLTNNDSSYAPHSQERIYDTQWALYPAWSFDGNRIAMVAQFAPPAGSPAFEYNLSLYTLPATGGTRQQLYTNDEAHCGRMVYLPDRSALIYTHTQIYGDGQPQLYQLRPDTGSSEPVPGAPVPSYDPAVSRDGRWLAFAARDDARTDIWFLPTSTTSDRNAVAQRLTNLGMARAPVFAPDGRQMAFLAIPEGKAGFELWVVDLNTTQNGMLQAGTPRQLTRDMYLDPDSGLAWAP